jgi:hypothetical protein
MKTTFSIPFLLLIVFFTIIVPNHQFITRIKASLTLTEFDKANYEGKKTLTDNKKTEAPEVHSINNEISTTTLVFSLPYQKENSSLNLLYLAHSPPA